MILEDRILNHHREEKHWGFYAEAPLVEVLTNQQKLLELNPGAKLIDAVENRGKNKLHNAVSIVDGVFETAENLTNGTDGVLRQAGIGSSQGVDPTVIVGFRFSNQE